MIRRAEFSPVGDESQVLTPAPAKRGSARNGRISGSQKPALCGMPESPLCRRQLQPLRARGRRRGRDRPASRTSSWRTSAWRTRSVSASRSLPFSASSASSALSRSAGNCQRLVQQAHDRDCACLAHGVGQRERLILHGLGVAARAPSQRASRDSSRPRRRAGQPRLIAMSTIFQRLRVAARLSMPERRRHLHRAAGVRGVRRNSDWNTLQRARIQRPADMQHGLRVTGVNAARSYRRCSNARLKCVLGQHPVAAVRGDAAQRRVRARIAAGRAASARRAAGSPRRALRARDNQCPETARSTPPSTANARARIADHAWSRFR